MTWLALILAVALADTPPPIAVGDYVQEGQPCADAPLAAMMSFDGANFSGPHATDCHDSTLSQHGRTWTIRSTCSALGDGTAAKPFTEVQTVRVLSHTRVSVADATGARPANFRLCPTH